MQYIQQPFHQYPNLYPQIPTTLTPGMYLPYFTRLLSFAHVMRDFCPVVIVNTGELIVDPAWWTHDRP